MFEKVHTVDDWYDGPRFGIADYQGQPHVYQSDWNDGEDLDAETFTVMPIDQATYDLALESTAIYLRWLNAFNLGLTTQKTHPSLPEDRLRYEELEAILKVCLNIQPEKSLKLKANFRAEKIPEYQLYVEWELVEATE